MTLSARSKQIKSFPRGLFAPLRQRFNQYHRKWLKRRIPPAKNVELSLNNIFIIPNKQGLGFFLILSLMFLGAVNYELNLAFSVVFLLGSLFLLTIFHTYRNLAGLNVSATCNNSVFAGESVEVNVILNRYGKRQYESIGLSFKDSRESTADLIEAKEQRVSLYVQVPKRGYFQPGRLTLSTTFPFGICRSWSVVDLKITCLVYPQPIPCDLDALTNDSAYSGKTNLTKGNDDFYALREYQRGDSLKHVAWKHYARGQGMFTKQYASNVDEKLWLRWNMFDGLELEERLSRLCYCVLQLDSKGVDYGLDLPSIQIEPANGKAHYEKVLQVLALYGLNPSQEHS